MAALIEPKRRKIFLESEDQAWEILAAINRGDHVATLPRIAAAKWAKFDARFWIQDADGLITPAIMRGLLDVQDAILRARGVLVEASDDLRTLSAQDRRSYEIKVKVKKGSTQVSFDLNEIASQLGRDLIGKMTPDQVFIAVILMILVFGGTTFFRAWAENRRLELLSQAESDRLRQTLEAQKFATDADLKKFELLADVQKRLPVEHSIIQATESGRIGLLKAVAASDGAVIDGVEFEPAIAKRMARSDRIAEEPGRLDGAYRVLKVDSTNPEGFKVQLEHLESGKTFVAGVKDALLSEMDKAVIQAGEWKKLPIEASVNVTYRDNQVVNAVVQSATKVLDDQKS